MKRFVAGTAIIGALVVMSAAVFAQRGGPAQRQVTLYDRQGKVIRTVGDPGPQGTMVISPDGKKVAVVRQGAIFVHDIAAGSSIQIGMGTQPTWSPDSTKVAYQSARLVGTSFYIAPATGGAEELQYTIEPVPTLTGWSPDGRYLLYSAADPSSPGTAADLYGIQVVGQKKLHLLLRTPAAETGPRISPDGRYLTYRSNESGAAEFYIRPFDSANPTVLPPGTPVKISNGIGTAGLRWRADGKEVYYISMLGEWMAAEISTSPTLKVGAPIVMFALPDAYMSGQQTAGFSDVSGDGKIFALFIPVTPR